MDVLKIGLSTSERSQTEAEGNRMGAEIDPKGRKKGAKIQSTVARMGAWRESFGETDRELNLPLAEKVMHNFDKMMTKVFHTLWAKARRIAYIYIYIYKYISINILDPMGPQASRFLCRISRLRAFAPRLQLLFPSFGGSPGGPRGSLGGDGGSPGGPAESQGLPWGVQGGPRGVPGALGGGPWGPKPAFGGH